MCYRFISALAALGCLAGVCQAAPQITLGKDPRNPIPGTVSYGILVDNNGLDWTVAAMKVDLTAGSVYNHPTLDSDEPQQSFWALEPELEWDTWFGVPGDSTNGIPGGAGDLGGGPFNIGGTGVDAISVSWFNTDTTNTGLTRIANVTFTDDAAGTWSLIAGGNGQFTTLSGTLGDLALLGNLPAPLPEPTTLALLGLGAAGLLIRPHRMP